MTKIEFIKQMTDACNEAILKEARFNKAVIFAQAALESNWGNSELALKANNLFAIKTGKSWAGEMIWLAGSEWNYRYGWYNSIYSWRKYLNWTDCIIDYSNIIAGVSYFQDALKYIDDPQQFLKALLPDETHPGWATDPDYYHKIMRIAVEIENYGGPKWSLTINNGKTNKDY